MRLLIYGMQSSGASTLTLLLAQKPDCGAFVDIWTMFAAPRIQSNADVVAKVVITTCFPLEVHRERFQPDRTLLVLRNPAANYRSLAAKSYRHHCGFMEEKFALLDRIFENRAGFDAVIHYEDLLETPLDTLNRVSALGWHCATDYLGFARRQQEIVSFNHVHLPEVTGRLDYGAGKWRGTRLSPELAGVDADLDWSVADRLCPSLSAHYRARMARRPTVSSLLEAGE